MLLAQSFATSITIDNSHDRYKMRFGVDPAASDSVDVGFDILCPEIAPGVFIACWETDSRFLMSDIRNNSQDEKTFTLAYNNILHSDFLIFSWDSEEVSGYGNFVLQNIVDNTQITLDMTRTDSLIIYSMVDSLTIKWDLDNESDIAQYRLQRSVNSTEDFEDLAYVEYPWHEYIDYDVVPNTMYAYRVSSIDRDGKFSPYTGTIALIIHDELIRDSSLRIFVTPNESISSSRVFSGFNAKAETSKQTNSFDLLGNYPNPFNPSTAIRFNLPAAGEVSLTIFDGSGRQIRKLLSASLDQGVHEIVWDGTNDARLQVASGVYFYRLTHIPPGPPSKEGVSRDVLTRKMVLVR